MRLVTQMGPGAKKVEPRCSLHPLLPSAPSQMLPVSGSGPAQRRAPAGMARSGRGGSPDGSQLARPLFPRGGPDRRPRPPVSGLAGAGAGDVAARAGREPSGAGGRGAGSATGAARGAGGGSSPRGRARRHHCRYRAGLGAAGGPAASLPAASGLPRPAAAPLSLPRGPAASGASEATPRSERGPWCLQPCHVLKYEMIQLEPPNGCSFCKLSSTQRMQTSPLYFLLLSVIRPHVSERELGHPT